MGARPESSPRPPTHCPDLRGHRRGSCPLSPPPRRSPRGRGDSTPPGASPWTLQPEDGAGLHTVRLAGRLPQSALSGSQSAWGALRPGAEGLADHTGAPAGGTPWALDTQLVR